MTSSLQPQVTLLVPVFPRTSHAQSVLWTAGHTIEPWQAQLVRIVARSDWDAQHLPAAELVRGSHEGTVLREASPTGAPVVCADPIHLRADRDSATLIPAQMLHLEDDEADALLDSINEFLLADDLHLCRTEPGRWFMSGKDGSLLASHPPSFLAHRNASAFLPDGETTGSWRRLMTELQMLLHVHPVNAARERQGRLPVNSVWFWGGASLQTGTAGDGVSRQSTRLYADDTFSIELARQLGLPVEPLAAFDPMADHSHSVVVDTHLAQALFAEDEIALEAAERHIVDQWVAPIQARIEAGDALELTLLNEDGTRGRLDESVVRTAAAEARAARVAQMALPARLADRVVVGAKSLWLQLRHTFARSD